MADPGVTRGTPTVDAPETVPVDASLDGVDGAVTGPAPLRAAPAPKRLDALETALDGLLWVPRR